MPGNRNDLSPVQVHQVQLGPVAHGGHFIARQQGRVIFVRGGLPGETVRVALTEAPAEASYWRGEVIEVLSASEHRVRHIWPLADPLAAHADGRLPVGGAEFGHIDLAFQRSLKAAVLSEQLRRLAGLALGADIAFDGVQPAAEESADGLAWRTRMAYGVDAGGRLAMHPHRSEQLIPVGPVPLAVDAITDLRLHEHDFTGASRVEVAAPASGGKPLLLLAAGTRDFRRIAEGFDAASLVPAQWNPLQGKARTRDGRTPALREAGPSGGLQVSGDGFWQIHRTAARTLTQAVRGYLAPLLRPGDSAADLYAGAGLFTQLLVQLTGGTGSVVSVEGYPVTSADAAANFAQNQRVAVVQGKVERVLNRRDHRLGSDGVGVVVLDPPRAGAGKGAVAAIARLARDAVVYVSCDPASFARDLGYFREAGWAAASISAFDLYPHTHHLETVALLRRR